MQRPTPSPVSSTPTGEPAPAARRTAPSPLVDGRAPRRPRLRAWALAGVLVAGGLLPAPGAPVFAQTDPFATLRHHMVDDQLRKRGIKEPGVLAAMETVPRHLFVPEREQNRAYQDAPVAFAPGQNLPHAIVSARMLEVLDLDGDDKVLEIGTGSGYDAALLSQVAGQVYTVEIDRDLADRARKTLRRLGFDNVEVRVGDGYRGWPEKAPFDAILLTVSTPEPPPLLYEQLAVGGRMVVAVGSLIQEMQLIVKTAEGPVTRPVSLVNLGPMTGEVNQRER